MNGDPAKLRPEAIEAVLGVRVPPDPPSDFVSFWQQTVAELREIPLDLELNVVSTEAASDPRVERLVWSATSLGGRRISGPLTRPKGARERLPQWVYGHGYGSVQGGTTWRPELAHNGFIAVGLDARGYARSRVSNDPSVPGWVLHGIDSPKDYILRGAVADTVRAVEVARALEGADPSRTVLSGGSFSGGLAILAAPWIPDLRYVAASVPTFGAYDLRRTLVERGSGKEVNDFLATLEPEQQVRIRENLRYFDAVNAAAHIEAGTISIGLGIIDVVVPGETVAAIYHAIRSTEKELLHYPCSHSAHPLSREWAHWDRHIIERAKALTSS